MIWSQGDRRMNRERVILYTWQDAENYLYSQKNRWPSEWIKVDVYSTEIVIYVGMIDEDIKKNAEQFFLDNLREYYVNGNIQISVTNTLLNITFEATEEKRECVKPYPLFKDFSYISDENKIEIPALKGVPVIAFHSYKGGVGRTLSLITFVRTMIEQYGTQKKVLIVDGDIEAPGLTWLGREQYGNYEFSYIDLLNVISAKGIDDSIYENISHLLEGSYLKFHDTKLDVEQFFLPTYRNENQLLDIYSKPERIMAGEKNKYVITDAISTLGQLLNVDAVLVDLRAGISEYSAPFLFDPRVKKVIVTSTSSQSITGTELLLKQLKKQKDNSVTDVLLTMVNRKMISQKKMDKIYECLLQEGDAKTSNDVSDELGKMDTITEVEKQDVLIHLGSLDEICDILNTVYNGTQIFQNVFKSVFTLTEESNKFTDEQITLFRENLHKIATDNVTAEGNDKVNLLITKSVMQLGNFTREVPKINILGAKGSGKTYLFKQMIAAKTWSEFLNVIGKKDYSHQETLICPVLCSDDRTRFIDLLNECLEVCKVNIPKIKVQQDIFSNNEKAIRTAVEGAISENQWIEEWERLVWNMFEGVFGWNDLNEYLEQINKRVIFIFDGLENLLFSDTTENILEKKAVKALCKGVMNHLYEYRLDNIGMIVYLRKDMAESAIDINFEQFRNQYQKYELNWEQEDALKLAWKLADNAAKKSSINLSDDTTPIYNLSYNVIEQNLVKVWGKKMGSDGSKTAGTNRWVRASLSDFNGQLQARDIVRFLKYATIGNDDGKREYHDRLLTPDLMKAAVQKASEEKLGEVEREIHPLKKSFQILKDIPKDKKQIPLLQVVLDKLPNEDMKLLERHGYLKEADDEYYVPESIRYALGYNKTRRGGIKLVSLLANK